MDYSLDLPLARRVGLPSLFTDMISKRRIVIYFTSGRQLRGSERSDSHQRRMLGSFAGQG
jgi:hypothetical protein